MSGSTNFPTSLDSHASASPLGFGEVNNQAYTLSTAAHSNSVTTITVASTSKFPSKGYLVIKREIVSYTGTTATTFTGCTRGVGGTTAAAFASGTLVEQVPVAANHNDLAAALVAVETKLGITSSTPTASKVLGADGTGTSSWRQVATADIAADAATKTTSGSTSGTTTSATLAQIGSGHTINFTAGGGICYFNFACSVAQSSATGLQAMTFRLDGGADNYVHYETFAAGETGSRAGEYALNAGASLTGSHAVVLYFSVSAGSFLVNPLVFRVREYLR